MGFSCSLRRIKWRNRHLCNVTEVTTFNYMHAFAGGRLACFRLESNLVVIKYSVILLVQNTVLRRSLVCLFIAIVRLQLFILR